MTVGLRTATSGARAALGLTLLAIGCGTGEEAPAPNAMNSLVHDGLTRTYLLHVPPGYSSARPAPLVIGLHGYTSSSTSFERQSGLSEKADQEGFIVAYPDGLRYPWTASNPQAWNAGGPYEQWTGGTDDVGFIEQMIERIRRHYAVDGARIFVTGHSNGSRMTYRVGHALACTVAAIAPHSGQMVHAAESPARCPVALLHLHAVDDPEVRYEGATSDDPNVLSYLPVETVLGRWAGMYGCSTSAVVAAANVDYTVLDWPCPGGSPAIGLYRMARGGHHWFRPENAGLSATDTIWDFFSAHPRRATAGP